MIGLQLIVDGKLKNKLYKKDLMEILSRLPKIINMKILAGPIVVKGRPHNPGWTGFVIIDKSHIAIHTFDDKNKISIDIFSCKKFAKYKALKYLKSKLVFNSMTAKFLKRV